MLTFVCVESEVSSLGQRTRTRKRRLLLPRQRWTTKGGQGPNWKYTEWMTNLLNLLCYRLHTFRSNHNCPPQVLNAVRKNCWLLAEGQCDASDARGGIPNLPVCKLSQVVVLLYVSSYHPYDHLHSGHHLGTDVTRSVLSWPQCFPMPSRPFTSAFIKININQIILNIITSTSLALGDRTKWKTCFGGPRMILHAHWKNTFPK